MDINLIPEHEYMVLTLGVQHPLTHSRRYVNRVIGYRSGIPLSDTVFITVHGTEIDDDFFNMRGAHFMDAIYDRYDHEMKPYPDATLSIYRYFFDTEYILSCAPLDSIPVPFFVSWHRLSSVIKDRLFSPSQLYKEIFD
jgi:hypothetical protein